MTRIVVANKMFMTGMVVNEMVATKMIMTEKHVVKKGAAEMVATNNDCDLK